MPSTNIDLQKAQTIREQIEMAWKQDQDTLVTEAEDETWVKTTVKPQQMLTATLGLRVKAGYALHAYIYQENRDMNGVVWALPSGQSLPDPTDCDEEILPDLAWALDRIDLLAPYPQGALLNTMEAIEGDRSPVSYLSASFLAREFSEFGADYHGIYWGDYALLKQSYLDETSWEWKQALPTNWQPHIQTDDSVVRVTFYTTSDAGRHHIVRHVDTYSTGEYVFDTDETIIATGGKGFNR